MRQNTTRVPSVWWCVSAWLLSAAVTMAPRPLRAAPAGGGQSRPEAVDVQGAVTDQTGLPVAGAVVILRSRDTGFERITQTNAAGVFSFGSPAPGEYAATVTL